MVNMFWGLVLEPGKRYSQEVVKAFHISMATLEIDGKNQIHQNVPVLLEYEDGREFVLCNLNPLKRVQCALDLNFRDGEKIGFYSGSGPIRVHLTGYMMADMDDDSSEGESGSEDEKAEEEEMDEIEEISESTAQKRKESPIEKFGAKRMKVLKSVNEVEEVVEKDSDETTTPTTKKIISLEPKIITTENESGPQPDQKKKKKKKMHNSSIEEQNGQMQSPTSEKKKKKTKKREKPEVSPRAAAPQKRTIEGGVEIVDTKVGCGPVAKPGSKTVVYYVGRLKHNNKQFDATTSGTGFRFILCRNEVIKGWDVGIPGMRVGGKRTLTIPADMAYGTKGHPPVIPPNSTLVFDVELKKVF